jgi:hypothetical protein
MVARDDWSEPAMHTRKGVCMSSSFLRSGKVSAHHRYFKSIVAANQPSGDFAHSVDDVEGSRAN